MVLNHPEKIKLLSAAIGTFVLYNPNYDYFFYFSILYEINDEYIVNYDISIDFFQPNIYTNILKSNNNVKSSSHGADLMRLVISIYLTIFFIKEYSHELSQKAQKFSEDSALLTLMQAKYIIELTIIILYYARFAVKNYYALTVNSLDEFIVFFDTEFENYSYTRQIYKEFYNLKYFFSTDKLYDIILFFMSYIRVIGYFIHNPKTRDFLNFIFDSLEKIGYFMVFYMIVLIFLCVFCNNLFGLYFNPFKDFLSSFSYILLFCIGHNHLISSEYNNYNIWEMIFIFMIFIILVFFLNSVFVGIYLESFRLQGWKSGYSNQEKKQKGIFEKLINRLGKKKNKNKTPEIKKENNVEMQEIKQEK